MKPAMSRSPHSMSMSVNSLFSKSGDCHWPKLPAQYTGIWPPAACKSIYLATTG